MYYPPQIVRDVPAVRQRQWLSGTGSWILDIKVRSNSCPLLITLQLIYSDSIGGPIFFEDLKTIGWGLRSEHQSSECGAGAPSKITI